MIWEKDIGNGAHSVTRKICAKAVQEKGIIIGGAENLPLVISTIVNVVVLAVNDGFFAVHKALRRRFPSPQVEVSFISE